MNGHVFNQPIGEKELGLGQPLLTWYPTSVSECVSDPYPGNLDNGIMVKNQGEMKFFIFWMIYMLNGTYIMSVYVITGANLGLPKVCGW